MIVKIKSSAMREYLTFGCGAGVAFGVAVALAINSLSPEEASSYPSVGYATIFTFAGFVMFGFLMGLMNDWVQNTGRARVAGGIAMLPISFGAAYITNQFEHAGLFMYVFAVVYAFIMGSVGGPKIWRYADKTEQISVERS